VNSELQQTLAEAKALSTLLTCMAQGAGDHALPLVRTVWENFTPEGPTGWLSYAAMSRLLGFGFEVPELTIDGDEATQLFMRTAHAWALWARGRSEEARALLRTKCEPGSREGQELHLMALGPWCLAVGALLEGDREEARRLFRRSMEVGSQFGTETNEAIQWAYAATFLDQGAPTSSGELSA